MRYLTFDRFVESSMEIAPPHRTRSAYTDYFHLGFLVAPELPDIDLDAIALASPDQDQDLALAFEVAPE